ncbi:MAG: type VI secretion system tip protein TssI/VgrG [Myxococcota bacterium]
MLDPLRDLYAFESEALPPDADVTAFRCDEGLSTLYRLSVGVVTRHGRIDLLAARGQAATLEVRTPALAAPFVFHGIIVEAALRHAWEGHTLYELVVVPRAWTMTLSHHSRVFVDKTVPEVIEAILKDGGLTAEDFELRLQRDYPPHFHTCQYKESRWAFVERLMEREGLYYFFEHGDESEKLIIVDDAAAHTALRERAAPYRALTDDGENSGEETFGTFTSRSRSTIESTLLRDFDYLNPGLDVSAEAAVWDGGSAAQMHIGDHDFREEGVGRSKAEVLGQTFSARALTFEAKGRVLGMRSGYRFTLEDHPVDSFNAEYLAVRVSHYGCQSQPGELVRRMLSIPADHAYHVTVEAVTAETPWRAPRRTPVPRVASVERAFVDGPADGDYAQIDEHGRYKVKFHFDIDDSDVWDGDASTWLRMLQPHGGGTEGFHFPLRKNTEVMVIFLGGDPDRPVIAGAVPNATQPSPVTSSNHTQNWIQTGGASRLEIEDQEGKKYIDVFTPPENTFLHLGVPYDDRGGYLHFNTNGNQLITIGANRDITVGGAQTVEIGTTFDTETGGTITVEGGGEYHVEISSNITFENGAEYHVESSGNQAFETGGHWDAEATGNISFEAGGDIAGEAGGNITSEAAGSIHLEAGGEITSEAPAIAVEATDLSHEAATWSATIGTIAWDVGSATINTPSWNVNNPTNTWKSASWNVLGASIKWTSSGDITLTGAKAEYTGIAVGATSAKMEATGMTLAVNGFEVVSGGPESRGKPVISAVTGLYSIV